MPASGTTHAEDVSGVEVFGQLSVDGETLIARYRVSRFRSEDVGDGVDADAHLRYHNQCGSISRTTHYERATEDVHDDLLFILRLDDWRRDDHDWGVSDGGLLDGEVVLLDERFLKRNGVLFEAIVETWDSARCRKIWCEKVGEWDVSL